MSQQRIKVSIPELFDGNFARCVFAALCVNSIALTVISSWIVTQDPRRPDGWAALVFTCAQAWLASMVYVRAVQIDRTLTFSFVIDPAITDPQTQQPPHSAMEASLVPVSEEEPA